MFQIRFIELCALAQVLDEINDQTDQMEQIQQAMGQPIGAAADFDEDELLNELEVPIYCLLLISLNLNLKILSQILIFCFSIRFCD